MIEPCLAAPGSSLHLQPSPALAVDDDSFADLRRRNPDLRPAVGRRLAPTTPPHAATTNAVAYMMATPAANPPTVIGLSPGSSSFFISPSKYFETA